MSDTHYKITIQEEIDDQNPQVFYTYHKDDQPLNLYNMYKDIFPDQIVQVEKEFVEHVE